MAVINLNSCFPPSPLDGSQGPLPKQAEFLNLVLDAKGPKYIGYYGGYGSGKTVTLCVAMIAQGVAYGGEYVIARQHMPELKRTTMKTFLETLPKGLLLEHRVADAEIHIKTAVGGKAIFYFVGLDEPGKLDSLNLSGFGIDESSYTSEEAFLKLQGRLRNPKGLRKGVLVGNPKGQNWVYHWFVKKSRQKETTEQTLAETKADYHMIVAPSTENVHLPSGYVAGMLASYSAERVKRDIYGSFDSFEGQVYGEFERSIHVVKPFAIPESWPKYIGIDHGFRNPTAWLWGAMDYDGNLWIYREFYQREWLIQEVCKGTKSKPGALAMMGKEKIEWAKIDPSTKAARVERNGLKISDYDIYLENLPSDFPLETANNDVTAGIDKVKSYLKISERTGQPRIYIFDTCSNLLDEIAQYRWKELQPGQEGKSNQKEEPVKFNDHACDALRYLIMGLPEAAEHAEADIYETIEYSSLEGALHRDLQRFKNPSNNSDPFGM